MSNYIKLPPALLDLVLARALASSTTSPQLHGHLFPLNTIITRRHSHAVAYKPASAAPYIPPGLLSRPKADLTGLSRATLPYVAKGGATRQMTELEKRVKALTDMEVTENVVSDGATYTEEELLLIYEDLLAVPQPPQADTTAVNYAIVLNTIAERMQQSANKSFIKQTSLLQRPDLLSSSSEAQIDGANPAVGSRVTAQAIISRLSKVVSEIAPPTTETVTARLPISPGLLAQHEWSALARTFALEQDISSVHQVFDLMKRSASLVAEESLNGVLAIYADKGDVAAVESLFREYLTEAPTDRQRDLHVKSYLRASSPSELPSRALTILHDYEARALPAPQHTYTRCITHLFSAKSSVAHAHAWDLFSHMRYAAHPTPDALLYTLMIRACANSSFSTGVEAERALDLFHEMTVDQHIAPTSGAYTAAILACACSGRKDYVHEAFRLAKQMLNSHRDARGDSAFAPDTRLFKALLEGAKRIGDLGRARWLLAEMVRVASEMERKGSDSAAMRVDGEVMVHVFNAYATYRPPFRRSATKFVKDSADQALQNLEDAEKSASSSAPASEDRKDLEKRPQKPAFSHLPPQSRAELIAEARLLMEQIVEQNKAGGTDVTTIRFKHVRLTPQLLNAYLSVHYAHSSVETIIELYRTIFENLAVSKVAATYVEALERFSRVRRQERMLVKPLADEIWSEWEGAEEAWRRGGPNSLWMNARIVERANTAMIRLLSITGQLDRALGHVKAFVERYSFAGVRTPAAQLASRSTRTVLAGARPLVRLTSAVDIPDDTVPPFLTFPEVELLHHKLVAAKRTEGIKYVKWVCKSYEGALRVRRDRSLQVREGGTDTD